MQDVGTLQIEGGVFDGREMGWFGEARDEGRGRRRRLRIPLPLARLWLGFRCRIALNLNRLPAVRHVGVDIRLLLLVEFLKARLEGLFQLFGAHDERKHEKVLAFLPFGQEIELVEVAGSALETGRDAGVCALNVHKMGLLEQQPEAASEHWVDAVGMESVPSLLVEHIVTDGAGVVQIDLVLHKLDKAALLSDANELPDDTNILRLAEEEVEESLMDKVEVVVSEGKLVDEVGFNEGAVGRDVLLCREQGIHRVDAPEVSSRKLSRHLQ